MGLSRNLCAFPRDRSDVTRDPQTCTQLTVPGKRATVLLFIVDVYCDNNQNGTRLDALWQHRQRLNGPRNEQKRFQLDNAMSSLLINRARGSPIFPLSKRYVLDSVRRPVYDVFRSIRTFSYSLHTLHMQFFLFRRGLRDRVVIR